MPTIISFETTFDLTLSPKQFKFVDTSDYAGQGVDPTDQNGCFTIVSPSGLPYYANADYSNSGCDIEISLGTGNKIPITLPSALGYVEPGTYVITYKSKNVTTGEISVVTNTYTFAYTAPTLSISQQADCISKLFTSTDNTVYAIAGATLTLIRQHKLTYPAGSVGAGSPITTASAIIGTSTFYNGTQTTTISSSLQYVFTDGLIVKDLLAGSRDELVNCRDICSITCCITNFETRMSQYQTENYEKYLSDYKWQWLEMMGYVGMIKDLAIPCGVNNDKISYYLNKIKEIGNCTDDCCTGADDYSQVMGLGVINVIVESGGEPVVVNVDSSSGTVIYTITLTSAFVDKVNNAYNSSVVAGDNIGVAVLTNPDGSKVYTISGKKAIVVAGNGITVTPSAEAAGVITYTVTADIAAGDNIGVSGTTTYTIAGKKAIVVAGAGITVTPSAEAAGVITYTVTATGGAGSVVADATVSDFGGTPFDIGGGLTLITGASFTVPTGGAGDYMFFLTGIINSQDPFETVLMNFQIRNNAVLQSFPHVYKGLPPDAFHSISIIEKLTVADTDVVDFVSSTNPVSSGQIQDFTFAYIKIG